MSVNEAAAAARLRRRASGLLLHPTSLPGPFGIGDLGPQAERFARFLAQGAQSWWQMLPVGPIGPGNSPYSSPSSFAGNPLLISLELLVSDGLLEAKDLEDPPAFLPGRVDYDAARSFKEPLLRKAFAAFAEGGSEELWSGFRVFAKRHQDWLEDYAIFRSLKETKQGPWTGWEPRLRRRDFRRWEGLKALGEASACHQFHQFIFQRQWTRLREICARLGVGLIGDVPIYAAQDSADVWARQDIFQLGEDGRPSAVAGVPPDYFSEDGQLWGNPLYRWEVLKERGYDWWISRLRQAAERFDAVRLDHFIGFCRYWEVPAGEKTAKKGRWVPGPGADFFEKVVSELRDLELIAEDLGTVTPEVTEMRDRFGLPGMRVLQFSFGADDGHLPERWPKRSVAYTGTHDNDTTAGWFADPARGTPGRDPKAAQRERENALRCLGGDGREIHWDMIKACLDSPSDTAIVPVQDLLGLGTQARMNLPGREEGNWEWRLTEGALTDEVTMRLESLARASGRAHEGSR